MVRMKVDAGDRPLGIAIQFNSIQLDTSSIAENMPSTNKYPGPPSLRLLIRHQPDNRVSEDSQLLLDYRSYLLRTTLSIA